ncbi:MAG: alpha/beta hydrolase [Ignavibacteria bacterium]|nr:alpha/beta hydrolase [Ignavibacteria bacterium]
MKNKNNKLPIGLIFIRWAFKNLEKTLPWLANRWAVNLFFTPIHFPEPEAEKKMALLGSGFTLKHKEKNIRGYYWGQGPVVVLLHGWSGRGLQFFKLISTLVDNGYRAVTFDGPAHGKSDGKTTDLLEYSEVIAMVAKKFGDIHSLVGHSFGGVAALYAIREGLAINNLVMISTPTIADDIVREFLNKINASPKVGLFFKKYFLNKFGKDFDSFSARVLAEDINDLPILLIHDEEDREVPIQHPLLFQEVKPEAKLIRTTGLGHTRILKNERVIDETISFINRNNSLNEDPIHKKSNTLFVDAEGSFELF